MNPLALYRKQLQKPDFNHDPAQEQAMHHFERLWQDHRQTDGKHWRERLRNLLRKSQPAAKGLYLWGGVGRGKTHLMDLFVHSIPSDKVMRIHFHRFMQRVQHLLEEVKGRKNPLQEVTARLLGNIRILCLDEFHVTDIGDAMILSNLLKALFEQRIVLVTTSNSAPAKLYWNGLQRERFLPAIEMLNIHCEVVEMVSATDYRLLALERAPLYHWPADEKSEELMLQRFEELAPEPENAEINTLLEIDQRPLVARRLCDDVVWFEFKTLCEANCGQRDYLELAQEFHTLLLSGVPVMSASLDSAARRFIHLVDILYEHCVKLIVSAEAPAEKLYTGTQLQDLFARTYSRLSEMQRHDYLTREHR